MYTISKEFHFSASHQLTGLPPEHPCSRLHGHNYIIICEFQSPTLNEVGFVIDYRDLDSIKNYVDLVLDHKHLNDVFPKMNPTAENIAKVLFKFAKSSFPQLSAIYVKETTKTLAKYDLSFDTDSPLELNKK